MATSFSQILQTGPVEFVVAFSAGGAEDFGDAATPLLPPKPMCGKIVGKHSSDAMMMIVP